MNDAGYTLVETLLALVMLSLAVAGLSMGLQVFGERQLRTAAAVTRLQDLRMAQAALEDILDLHAPFRSDLPAELSGEATRFHFACAAPEPCEVSTAYRDERWGLKVTDGRGSERRLPLHLASPAEFRFVGERRTLAVWPDPAAGAREGLRAVALVEVGPTGETPVLTAHVWREQPADCVFDTVLRDCR